MKHKNIRRVGIFDSGIGGICVLQKIIPLGFEEIIYLQDRKNLPYGDKSPDFIRQATIDAIDHLQTFEPDLIIIPCHTACCYALDALKKRYPQTPFVGVLDLIVKPAVDATKNRRIGIMATTATIASHMHKEKLIKIEPRLHVFEQACPKLVPLIEQSPQNEFELKSTVQEYCMLLVKQNIDTLLLGCTHYEHLYALIAEIMGPGITIISSHELIVNLLLESFSIEPSSIKTEIRFIESAALGYRKSIGDYISL